MLNSSLSVLQVSQTWLWGNILTCIWYVACGGVVRLALVIFPMSLIHPPVLQLCKCPFGTITLPISYYRVYDAAFPAFSYRISWASIRLYWIEWCFYYSIMKWSRSFIWKLHLIVFKCLSNFRRLSSWFLLLNRIWNGYKTDRVYTCASLLWSSVEELGRDRLRQI